MMVEDKRETRASETAPDPLVGTSFNGYRVEEVIGRGGMGVVYKAQQLSLNRPVAIKVLPQEFTERPQFLDRFHREVDVLSRLSHPNIVTVMERGEVEGSPYLVMEYVEGTSLRDVIKRGPLPHHEALAIVRSVLSALEHAHEKGVIHRDIKPENVLVAKGGVVKVADFGLGRLIDPQESTRLTHTHLMLGTFEYMSPEQREKAKEADERSDLYATGVVLYEMLAGELPIGAFEPLSKKRPDECDSRIDDVVQRSLDKSPDNRFQRASEMGEAVSRLLTPVPPEAPPAADEPARKKEKKKDADDEEEMNLHGYVAILAPMIGVAFAALRGFDLGGTGWTLWGLAVGASIIFLPPLLKWLWTARNWFAMTGATVVPIALMIAYAIYWGDDEYEMEAARVTGPLSETFEERILENPKVQIFIRDAVFPYTTWANFPNGLEFKRKGGGKIVVEFEKKLVDAMAATRIAAAIGEVLAKNSGGSVQRILTVDSTFEKKLADAPIVAESN